MFMQPTRKPSSMVAIAWLGVTALCACDSGGLVESEPLLPSLDVFLIPSPEDTRAQSSSNSSAVCATGTTSIDRIHALIDDENALSAADSALIEAALADAPEGDLVVATYEAEIDGRTLRIEVVSEEGSGSVFTGTLIVGDEESEVLSGTVGPEGVSGTLVLEMPDTEKVSVAYDNGDDMRRIVRTRGDKSAVFELTESDARLVVDEVVAWWNVEASSGIIVDGADVLCFEGGESASDLCDLTCTSELIEKVTGN
jgi:hypothetical protein